MTRDGALVERWRVTLALHRDTGLVEVWQVGVPAPAPRVTWARALEKAAALVGPGVTVRVRVLEPAGAGTYKTVNVYRLQLPRDKETRKAARGGKDSAA